MDPVLNSYLAWLRERGVSFVVSDDLERRPDFDGPLRKDDGSPKLFQVNGAPILEHRDVDAVFAADHATADVAAAMERPSIWNGAQVVWDIGCGTGILAILAARAGARVIASDVDERAIALARATVAEANALVDLRLGPYADPMKGEAPADLIVANLPHKPNAGTLPVAQDGGPNGARHHNVLRVQAKERLKPGGRVLMFLHSLPAPEVLRAYGQTFDLSLASWKVRWFGPREYGDLQQTFAARAKNNTSYLVRDGTRVGPVGCVWVATAR